MSAALDRPLRRRTAAARVAAAAAALSVAFAFAQPTWVFDPEGVYPERQQGVAGVAYVEAARFPADVTQEATGLFVVCDALAPDSYELFLWAGPVPDAALDAAGTVEVLTRRGDDAARSARWSVEADPVGQVLVANDAVRALLLDDVRRGGSLAVRVLTDSAAGTAQPTFVYEVGGFPEVELACVSRATAADDPFAGAPVVPVEPDGDDPFADAPVAPVDPFANAPLAPAAPDPFADAPAAPNPFAAPPAAADPFATPPAPSDPVADASPEPGDGFDEPLRTDPTTGLQSLFGTIDDFAPLPPRLELAQLLAEPTRAIAYADPDGGIQAIGGFCSPEGGGENGFVIELGSPAFAAYGDSGTVVVYVDGLEVGFAELGVYRDDVGAAAFVTYDEDELGLLRAFEAFADLEMVLTGDGVAADAYWWFTTADLAAAITALDCAP